MHLLVQADQQGMDAVGLALSVASMESLLCRNEPNLANMLSENVATLLEADPRFRAAAVQYVKRLYDLRSKVLHGALTDCSRNDVHEARCLAAAVLKAFVERRMMRKKAGYADEKPDDLLNELRDDKYTPDQLTFVNPSAVAALWRCPDPANAE